MICLVHFVGDGIFSPVIDSQVIVPLGLLSEIAPDIDRSAVFLTSFRHSKAAVATREAAIRAALPGVRLHFRTRPPGSVPFQHRIWARKLGDVIRRSDFRPDDSIILHCRGECTTAAAGIVKHRDRRVRVLMDVRGAQSDEIKAGGLLAWYLRGWADRMSRRAAVAADAANTVSNVLAAHLRSAGAVPNDLPVTVVGCCVDTTRFAFDPEQRARRRAELGLTNNFVACYCGAMSHWQRPDAIAECFAAIRSDMPDARMLVISKEAGPLREHLVRLGVSEKDVICRSAPHDQVASFLMAGDVGLLLRENTLTNRVASPVKFAEYLRCGLPVILTPYIGDLGKMVVEKDLGRTIEFPVRAAEAVAAAREIRERLTRDGDAYRPRLSDFAAEQMSWRGQLPKLIDVYRRLSGLGTD